ncbi:2342_t:CDS:2, partial [Racocetra persica]
MGELVGTTVIKIMDLSTGQTIYPQPQNHNGQPQRPQNFGTGLNAQNAENSFTGTILNIQQYNDLVGGTVPFARTQRTHGGQISPQSDQFPLGIWANFD